MSKTEKPADKLVVTLELTQREVDALAALTLRGASWTHNGAFGKDVAAIHTVLSTYTSLPSDYYSLRLSHIESGDGFPIWK